MAGQIHDFDRVHRLDPDAVGVPGQRRFRIVVQNDQETAFLWLEKEQLQALGLAVDQLLTPVKAIWTREGETAPVASSPSFNGSASVELRVGRLGLGFDENTKEYMLVAHDVESDADDPPSFQCRCARAVISRLSESIATLTSAGRPRCPVCGSPLDDSPHFCPGSNGHAH
ncbi:MAG TPA: DUF3090 family protein [Chloroflexota bacterium]|nr:DUF3090 family protein [Chloroflexota bacterium]